MTVKVLSIAGFDGSGGAGIQADLKTFSAFGCYGMTVLTALPIQNTCGVKICHALEPSMVQEQLEIIFADIVPDAIKIGMLFQPEIVEVIVTLLQAYSQKIPIVLDPVMIAKSGDSLLQAEAITILKERLLPLVSCITPNLPEASVLISRDIATQEDMVLAAQHILTLGPQSVFIKGGHLSSPNHVAADFYKHADGLEEWLLLPNVPTKNTHGTGCTLSAGIAAGLALGWDLLSACRHAKHYLHFALQASSHQKIGRGCGPVIHHDERACHYIKQARTMPTSEQLPVQKLSFSQMAWTRIQPIYQALEHHEVIKALREGTLNPKHFGYYLTQDACYLQDFAQCYALITARLPAQYRPFFLLQATEVLPLEHAMIQQFLPMSSVPPQQTLTKAAFHYSNYLIRTCLLAPYEVALAALLPCYWIYRELGRSCATSYTETHPYAAWIAFYSHADFNCHVEQFIAIVDILAQQASAEVYQAMLEAFYKSSVLEWHFWNDVYHQRAFDYVQ